MYATHDASCALCEEEEHGSHWWDIEYKDGYYFFANYTSKGVIQASPDKKCMANTRNRGASERMIVSPVALSGSYVKIPPRYIE